MTATTKEQREELARLLNDSSDCHRVYIYDLSALLDDAEKCADLEAKFDAVSERCTSAIFDLKYARRLAESLTRRAEAAEAKLQIAVEALDGIAAWHEGETVGPCFDEPLSAYLAREALVKMRS